MPDLIPYIILYIYILESSGRPWGGLDSFQTLANITVKSDYLDALNAKTSAEHQCMFAAAHGQKTGEGSTERKS